MEKTKIKKRQGCAASASSGLLCLANIREKSFGFCPQIKINDEWVLLGNYEKTEEKAKQSIQSIAKRLKIRIEYEDA